MGGRAQWQLQEPLEADRQLIRVDLPGFGNNAGLDPIDSIAGFAKWLLEMLSQQGVEQFDLLGHSMGGMVVQELVQQAPGRVARLILYSTGAMGVLPGRFETIETSIERAQKDGAETTARRISASWFLKREAAKGYEECADIACQATLPAILAGLAAMRGWSGEHNLTSIGAKTLVIWGDGDRTYGWQQIEQLWNNIPNSNLAVVPQCAHAVHAERPHFFNSLVDSFLRDP